MKYKILLLSFLSFNTWSIDHKINIELTNSKQIGHSDGYANKGKRIFKKEVFTGTNIYSSNMNVTYQGKSVSILTGFTITEVNANESIKNPTNIFIGDISGNNKGSSQLELEKLRSIGVTKEDFEKQLKNQFENFYLI